MEHDGNGLPRLRRKMILPVDLVNRDSRLGNCIRIANEAIAISMSTAEPLIHETQELARAICPKYQPDEGDPGRILCNSGHDGQPPYLGLQCANGGCQLSQVIHRGPNNGYFYTGGDQAQTEEKRFAQPANVSK